MHAFAYLLGGSGVRARAQRVNLKRASSFLWNFCFSGVGFCFFSFLFALESCRNF